MYRRALVERGGDFRRDLLVIQDDKFLFDPAYHGVLRFFGSCRDALCIRSGSLFRGPARFSVQIPAIKELVKREVNVRLAPFQSPDRWAATLQMIESKPGILAR